MSADLEMTPEQEEAFFRTGNLPDELTMGLLSNDEPAAAAPVAAEPAKKVETPVEDAPGGGEPSVLERLLDEERQRVRDLEARLAESKKAPVVEEQVPDPITDPLGNIIHQLDRSTREIASLKAQIADKDAQDALKNEFEQFKSGIKALKDDFAAKSAPDFDAAYKHVTDIRIADLMDLGHSRHDAQQIIWQDELRLAQAAISRGKNPAEQMYAMAKRYGYVAPAAGTATKAAPAAQAAAEGKVERLSNGQFASKPAGRAAPAAELSLDGLKDASNADLNQVVLDDTMWAKVVGGKGSPDIFHH